MKIRYLFGIISVLFLLVGCGVEEAPKEPAAVEEITIPEEPEQVVEELEEATMEEDVPEVVDLEVRLTDEGFETEELTVAKGSRVTIINDAIIMHKLTGGDLFKGQFNTHLKTLYGNKDPLERNKLAVGFIDIGEYEIKDLTTQTVLLVKVG